MKDTKTKKDYISEKDRKKRDLDDISTKIKKTSSDKITSTDAVNKLNLTGTKDFISRMKNFASSIESHINALIGKQEIEHKKISNDGEREEKEIKENADVTRKDGHVLRNTEKKVFDTKLKKELNEAASEAKKDSEWLERLKEKRERERGEYRKIVGNEIQRAMSAQVTNFSKFGGFF